MPFVIGHRNTKKNEARVEGEKKRVEKSEQELINHTIHWITQTIVTAPTTRRHHPQKHKNRCEYITSRTRY